MIGEDTRDDDPAKLLRKVFRGFERRRTLEGAARVEVDRQLLEALDHYSTLAAPEIRERPEPPPRPIGLAMASAIFGQPHLQITIGAPQVSSTEDLTLPVLPAPEPPIVVPTEPLAEALGLQSWELEDIREDTDRRVGVLLKQVRVARWLWSHFGLPQASAENLFRVLFPAAPGKIGTVGMARRCAQLYAMVAQEQSPAVETMFLPWSPIDDDKQFHPLRTFRGRYVNANLRKQLARSVGASDDEIVELLERMTTVVPRVGSHGFLGRDTWRARGFSAMTGLPAPYGESAWLARPLEPDEISTYAWLAVRDGHVQIGDVRAGFDVLATARVNEMLRQLYGAIVARVAESSDPHDGKHDQGDLIALDVEKHVRAVLKPLIGWAESPRTVAWLTQQANVPPQQASAVLHEVRRLWGEHLEQVWAGGPREGQPPTIAAHLLAHLIAIQRTLRTLSAREGDPRQPHRDTLLLFTGHLFARQPLERLWGDSAQDDTWPSATIDPADAVADGFWGAWMRVLAFVEDDSTTP